MSYRIISDTCCDLWPDFYKELDVDVVNMAVTYRNQSIDSYTETWLQEFYDGLRNGEPAQTSAVNPAQWREAMESVLTSGQDCLALVFSSGLSTTYQSAVIAAQELMEEYPQRSIKVVDSLCASMGQGLFLWYACQKRDQGFSLEALAKWCEETKWHICHWFTVDDLMYLKRGGRISAATALVGTMLQIKPVLHIDDAGHLIKAATARGRKASLDALAKKLGDTGLPGENETVFISHGDCAEDAEYLANKLRSEYGVKKVITYYIGAVIGSHAGPDTVALFFLGSQR